MALLTSKGCGLAHPSSGVRCGDLNPNNPDGQELCPKCREGAVLRRTRLLDAIHANWLLPRLGGLSQDRSGSGDTEPESPNGLPPEPSATCPEHPGDYALEGNCRACDEDRRRYREWKRRRDALREKLA